MPPKTVKAAPARVTEFTVTAAFPNEVSVSVLVEVAFRLMLPKSRVAELIASWAAMPVPVKATALMPPVNALLTRVMVPVAAPATVGLKLAWSDND